MRLIESFVGIAIMSSGFFILKLILSQILITLNNAPIEIEHISSFLIILLMVGMWTLSDKL